MAVLYAGRLSEMKKFGEGGLNSGASNDIEKATYLAYKSIKEFGMDSELFLYNDSLIDDELLFKEKIEKKLQSWIEEAREISNIVIENNWEAIEKVADLLLEKDTIEDKELESILKDL